MAAAFGGLLCLLGLGAWLAMRPVAAPNDPNAADARANAVASSGLADQSPDAPSSSAAANGEVRRPAADDARGAVAPIALRVLDPKRDPVAGATVRIAPEVAEIGFWDMTDAEPLLATASAQTSDAAGLVHAHLPRGVAMVTARKGELYGQQWIDLGDMLADPIELQVLPDRELLVRTRLADGDVAPQIPIELAYGYARGDTDAELQRHAFARTDDRGELVVRHAQRLFFPSPAAPQLLLRALVVGADTSSSRVGLVEPSTQVDLVCPAHGAFRGTSFGSDGRPLATPLAVELAMHRSGAEPQAMKVPLPPSTAPGTWLLHPIALGADWRIATDRHEAIDAGGPRRQGEVVEVTLRRPRAAGRLRFLVLGPDGTALANEPLHFTALGNITMPVYSDAAGLVDVPRRAGTTRILVVAPRVHADAAVRLANEPIEETASIDLGPVRLVPQPMLVQGNVVDARTGLPLPAYVSAIRAPTTTAAPAEPQEPDLDPRGELDLVQCAADGTFTLWGRAEGRVVVRAHRSRHALAQLEVPLGTRGVELRLEPERHLFVTLQFDENVDDEGIEAIFEPKRSSWASWRRDGSVRHQAMPLRTAEDPTLVVTTASGYPLLRFPPSAWRTSPRGATLDVDLRGRLQACAIEVQCGGVPVPASFQLLTGSEDDRKAHPEPLGKPFLLTTDRTWRALILPRAGGVVATTLRPGRNVVQVPAPARILCSCPTPAAELGGSLVFELLQLRRDEPLIDAIEEPDTEPPPPLPTTTSELGQDSRTWTASCRPDGEGAETFRIGRRGRYAVIPVLAKNGERVLLPRSTVEFEVSALDCEVPIVVPLLPAELAAAKAKLTPANETPR